jgi:NAD(P)H-hydrate epimerase
MIPVLDASQAIAWDSRARTAGRIPSRVLMESAGRGIAGVVAREFGPELRKGMIVVAGPGNNGGDGWVVARALQALGIRVHAAEAGTKRSDDCAANRALALASGVERLAADGQWPAVGVVVDALLGTGAEGPPRGKVGELAGRIAAFGAPVVGVDGPTGLDLSTGKAHGPIRARLTVTFGGARRGHLMARDWCGKIVVIDIGFPPPDPGWPELVDDRWARMLLPSFHSSMHKGDRGRVLVVGGDEGMAGAAIHATRSALAAGAGLVKLAAAEPTIRAAQESLPDALTLITELGPEVETELGKAADWADAVVVGPGIGRSKERQRFVTSFLKSVRKPAVVDADALQGGVGSWGTDGGARVLTPHPGEFATAFPGLASVEPFDAVVAAAKAAKATVLLKGVPTRIASPKAAVLVSASGNPSLATGGSGDVLSGLIGAFLARGLEPRIAAALGAHAMGRAAELASRDHSARATRPSDVIAALPVLWKRWAETEPPLEPPILVEIEPPQLV